MKSLAIVACALLIAAVANAEKGDFKAYENTLEKEVISSCASEAGITADEISNMNSDLEKVDLAKFGCYAACLFRNSKILEDGKVNMDAMNSVISETFKDKPDTISEMMKVTEKCAQEVASITDDCKIAEKLVQCVSKEMQ